MFLFSTNTGLKVVINFVFLFIISLETSTLHSLAIATTHNPLHLFIKEESEQVISNIAARLITSIKPFATPIRIFGDLQLFSSHSTDYNMPNKFKSTISYLNLAKIYKSSPKDKNLQI